jgi:hypothetical protein
MVDIVPGNLPYIFGLEFLDRIDAVMFIKDRKIMERKSGKLCPLAVTSDSTGIFLTLAPEVHDDPLIARAAQSRDDYAASSCCHVMSAAQDDDKSTVASESDLKEAFLALTSDESGEADETADAASATDSEEFVQHQKVRGQPLPPEQNDGGTIQERNGQLSPRKTLDRGSADAGGDRASMSSSAPPAKAKKIVSSGHQGEHNKPKVLELTDQMIMRMHRHGHVPEYRLKRFFQKCMTKQQRTLW